MNKTMPINTSSVSTAARQTLRKIRRINRLLGQMARKQGLVGLCDAESCRATHRAVKICRRQRRKFAALVKGH